MLNRVIPCLLAAAALAAVLLTVPSLAAERSAADASTPQRHVIYVPYEKLDQVFQAEDKGVFLPYSEFKELWEYYRRHHIAGPEDKPPVPVLVSRALYELTIEGEVARGTAALSIESLDEKWVTLPLPFSGIALSEATLDGKPVLLRATPKGYELLLHERGPHTLALTFAAPVVSRPGHKGVRFNVPQAALAKVNVTLPEADVAIDVDHLVSGQKTTGHGTTTFSAFLGPTDAVGIGWQPKEVERAEIPPLLHARTATTVIVTEGLMRARTSIRYDIMRAPAERFAVLVPGDFNLLDVSGPQIKTWDVEDTDGGKVLTVELHEPVEKAYTLTVEVERILARTDLTIEAPSVQAAGENVAREIGTVSIAASDELRVTVERTSGLARIDIDEAGVRPEAGVTPLFAYQYWKPGWTAALSIEKILPRVRADVVALTTIDKRNVMLHADVAYTVSDAGIFQLAVRIPSDLKVRTVGPESLVDSHTVTPEGEWQRVDVLLKEKKLGAFTITIFAERPMSAEFADGDTVAIPEVTVLDVERETGMVGIAAHAGYEVSPTDTHENLIKIAKQEFLARRPVSGAFEFRLAYRYAEHPYTATVTLTERSPQVTAQVDAVVDVGEDATTLTYVLTYSIRYAGIKELKFTIDPAAAKGLGLDVSKQEDFRIEGANIRDRKHLGDGVWQVTLDSEQTGTYVLTITAKAGTELFQIDSGAPPKAAIPSIEVKETMGIFQETGHFAIWKSPDLDVETAPGSDLEPRDARQLPPVLQSPKLAKGFRYLKHTPEVSLAVGVITYESAGVVGAIVQEAHYDMVVSLEGKLTVEAIYSIRNNKEQFFRIVLPENAKIYGAYVSGATVTPQMGENGERLIKVPQSADRDFTLRLIYETEMASGTMGAAGGLKLETPEIRGMSVSRLSVRLFLPKRYTYLRFHGTVPRVDYIATPWQRFGDRLAGTARPPALSGGYRARYGALAVERPGGDPAADRPDERATAGGRVPITKEGVIFNFAKLGGAGRIRVTYWRTTWWTFWEIVAALVVICAGVVLSRRGHVRRWHYLVAALVVIVIFYSFSVAEAWVFLFRWAFGGLVLLALAWLALALASAAQERRATHPAHAGETEKGGE